MQTARFFRLTITSLTTLGLSALSACGDGTDPTPGAVNNSASVGGMGAGGAGTVAPGGGTAIAGGAGTAGAPSTAIGGTTSGENGGAPTTSMGGVPAGGSAGMPQGGTGPAGGNGGTAAGGAMPAGGAPSTLPTGSIIFTEDFEAAGDGSVPAGWNSFVGYVVNMNNMPGGDAFALADSSKAHGGTKSLHVKGGTSPAMLTRPLPPGTKKVYMRSYVWLTAKLGQNPANNHETLIGLRGVPGGANNEVRFGEIKGVIGTNEVPSDDISPKQDQWGKGPVIAAGEWNCVEVAFLADTAAHEVRAWNNGTEVHLVNAPDQWNNGALGAEFLSDKFVEFIIGWHSFSNYANEVWFDDLVVATERVGCN